MSKLIDQRRARRLLERDGWKRAVGGKHGIKMTKPGERSITLPNGEYGKGLSHAILKEASLEKEGEWSSRSSYTRKTRDTGRRSASSRDASRQLER